MSSRTPANLRLARAASLSVGNRNPPLYRQLSKRYHPDTTALPPAIATAKFQQLNEAYATLNNPGDD